MKVTHSIKSAIIYVGIIELKSIGEITIGITLFFNTLKMEMQLIFSEG